MQEQTFLQPKTPTKCQIVIGSRELFYIAIVLQYLISTSSAFASTHITSGSSTNRNDLVTMNLNIPLETLSSAANSFAAANGIQVEAVKDDISFYQCAPISLLPNAFPIQEFNKAKSLMPMFNLLVDRVSRDGPFLQETLGGIVSDTDPYTAKLLELYKAIYLESSNGDNSNNLGKQTNFAKQADCLGILRSDFMLSKDRDDDSSFHIKQVELNTIAASFAGLSCKVSELHSFLIERYSGNSDGIRHLLKENQKAIGSTLEEPLGVPSNPSLERLTESMSLAVKRYVHRYQSTSSTADKPIVLFVVQDSERNTVDQRMLEFELWKNHRIHVVRQSLADVHKNVHLNSETGQLLLVNGDGLENEVALVYYRAGYAPTDYPDGYDGIEWKARDTLERSRATKCPSLGYHLAGTKKVQQALARPGIVEKFFNAVDQKEIGSIENLRKSFAGLYSLDKTDAMKEDIDAVNHVLSTEDGRKLYVLKPQREGGGYNLYGDHLYKKLRNNVLETSGDDGKKEIQMTSELGEYILMERLFPPQQESILLRAGKVEGTGPTVSELGIFGTILVSADGNDVYHNEYSGFLLRTKFSDVDEGGVASGFATLSSPYLC